MKLGHVCRAKIGKTAATTLASQIAVASAALATPPPALHPHAPAAGLAAMFCAIDALEGKAPAKPSGAVLKEEGAVPPMPPGAFVKEEQVAPPGALIKEEGVVPPMPPDAVVKQERVVVVKQERSQDGRGAKRQRKAV